MQVKVIDANVLIHDNLPEGDLVTVPSVFDEIKGRLACMKLSAMLPSREAVNKVRAAAENTGDVHDLSETDVQLVALALDRGLVLVTDDYSMQNVAEELGVKWEGAAKKGIREKWKWHLVCRGCGKSCESDTCEVCGSPARRRPMDK